MAEETKAKYPLCRSIGGKLFFPDDVEGEDLVFLVQFKEPVGLREFAQALYDARLPKNRIEAFSDEKYWDDF